MLKTRDAIRSLNRLHYAKEVSFYTTASLRPVEEWLVHTTAKTRRILDVGCGAGRVTAKLTDQEFNITGVDIVPECLAAARRSNPATPLKLVGCDMCALPFQDCSFDEVWCLRYSFNALLTEEDRIAALKEMSRICRPKGRILIESFNRWYLGKWGAFMLANVLEHFGRKLRQIGGSPSPQLPYGAFLYCSSKNLTAPPGFAYLPTPVELRRLAGIAFGPERHTVKSSSCLMNARKRSWLDLWGHSVWIDAAR